MGELEEIDDIYMVSEDKPLGSLSGYGVEEVGKTFSEIKTECEQKGLHVIIIPEDQTVILYGAIYVYHKNALASSSAIHKITSSFFTKMYKTLHLSKIM